MMLSTGMPELQRADDIKWLRVAFATDKTEQEAAEIMRYVIIVVYFHPADWWFVVV